MSFPSLPSSKEAELVTALQHWSLSNGLVIYPPDFKSYQPVSAPVTVFPTPFHRSAFKDADDVQLIFNELYAKVASDESWLSSIIDDLAKFDAEFTGKLWKTYQRAKSHGISQDISLGIFRSDYMVNQPTGTPRPQIKQIEFNTVSVSFGGLSRKVGQLHQYLNDSGYYAIEGSSRFYSEGQLPISESIDKLADGLADGNYYYNEESTNKNTVVLVIVQDNERNVFDQRLLEYSLLQRYGIKSIRLKLSEIHTKTFTDEENRLFINGTKDEVSVVYFRSGYAPNDFVGETDWENRYTLEISKAIKAPSLLTQLAGAKKIQQLLTQESILTRFLDNSRSDELEQIKSTFVQILPLDNSELGEKAKKLALETPHNFVLKPQREGGGNNIYKEDIPKFLKSLPENEWSGYILMELIHPPASLNKVIRNGELYNEPIISELGRFGTIVFNQSTGEIKSNKNAGWLLRSKFESSNEGGVAAGFGCVDSIVLID